MTSLDLLQILTREMKLRNYSPRTIEAYLWVAKDIYSIYKRPLRELKEEEIKEYLLNKQKRGLSSQTIALYANALNFMFVEIYKLPGYVKIKHERRQ